MVLKVKEIKPDGLVFEGENNISLSNKARTPGTIGLCGYGVVDSLNWHNNAKTVHILWAYPVDQQSIKVGDEIKFTRQ